ncbi:TetR/AcrR family transcriptional regulator [Marinobacter salarius]|uniref:TetR/AcrR family transcriptional regulator n=1 Tax=Marinobacter salarius TaxID=1420917 RepID=UPI0032F054A1
MRDLIVDKALKLFWRHGVHATGVERIIAPAQVAKKTLHSHFHTKDELILAHTAQSGTSCFATR